MESNFYSAGLSNTTYFIDAKVIKVNAKNFVQKIFFKEIMLILTGGS